MSQSRFAERTTANADNSHARGRGRGRLGPVLLASASVEYDMHCQYIPNKSMNRTNEIRSFGCRIGSSDEGLIHRRTRHSRGALPKSHARGAEHAACLLACLAHLL
ncbi:jg3219 [Pararge aegeria aegeria]|uniref:Jg3219 protein n=1 Tax=Pararge aegeria aegeria TaxID=348720 RepID=A0A8S4QW18_9NEOP|nr:jg3219 [Pararge aegeria aegeria]